MPGPRGDVGKGLSRCAAEAWAANLAMRKACKNKPVRYNGVQFLGWAVMPTQTRKRFLSGDGNWERLPAGRVLSA
jgi:hypothetical protein